MLTNNLKTSVKWIIKKGHNATVWLDERKIRQQTEHRYPPVFILGAPRSGTTLLYQLLLSSFEFAYFPNIANRYYMCPLTATEFGRKFCKEYHTSFASKFGFEKGCMAPSEAGNIWNRWFPHEKREGFNYTPENYLSEEDQVKIRKLISYQTDLFNAPFISKNVKMSVRLPALHQIFPSALFIWIKRNPIDTALSVLREKRENNRQLLSVLPKEIDKIRNFPEVEAVCSQLFYMDRDIQNDIKNFFSAQVITIHYDAICDRPHQEMEKIHSFLATHVPDLKKKSEPIPDSFRKSKPKTDPWITNAEIDHIDELIAQLYSKEQEIRI